jgi:hypothetical protein
VEGQAAAAAFSFPFALLWRTGRITAFILGEAGLFFDKGDHEQLLHTQRASVATIWAGDDGVSFFLLVGLRDSWLGSQPKQASRHLVRTFTKQGQQAKRLCVSRADTQKGGGHDSEEEKGGGRSVREAI